MNNTIYNKKYHYVYLITEISTNKKYIGARSSNIKPEIDLPKYKSSSLNKEFEKRQIEYPEDYNYEILSIHDNRENAINEEIRLHNLYDVGINPEYINGAKQTSNKFDTSGMVVVKDKNDNNYLVSKYDEDYLSGKLVYFKFGNKLSTEVKNKISSSLKGKKLSNETKLKLSNKLKGKIVSSETRKKLSKVNSGINNGMYNKKHTEESKYKMSLSRSGSKNPSAKTIEINNKIYATIKEASEELGINRNVIRKRCNSTDKQWHKWRYL